ncbi:SDR family NAD(P)-dependent oxidoreductase, partial [Mesorhizobium sp. M8A.F.Ca.ET.198.01.1.1]|uniref:SDR family NAD(P)-dependent oxidoreductase n=1 Tax=Mesorhizobium sp. M8A.F.Ca.ET.198.01.1.1 TaxID=2563966 RepID=UPI001FE06363
GYPCGSAGAPVPRPDNCRRRWRSPQVDILVNSAGIARLNTALDTPDEEWRLVMDVNVNGIYWASRAFGRSMVARKKGSIVNLGSMSGLIINGPLTAPSYMVSKGAVHMMTKALAV